MTTTETLTVVPHWIDGAEYPSTSGRTADVYDPALGVVTKRVALADRAEIDAANEQAGAEIRRNPLPEPGSSEAHVTNGGRN